ncbi:MAG TPA: response regulator [Desulfobacteraceae bacterium]|jgi:CheY-like chemotaxis protein|nr:response regulator [Desulfobacteraceae bacterium]HPJ66911.1 response regulator [Desulfobacteraceae bacterium]HPQ27607.1 response regulator [Desulfobacteraceae bacterium]
MVKAKKILVVDDEKGIRFLLLDFLSSEGFDVRVAKDGQESLEILERSNFDLVITDINMPGMDGISMLKTMKKAGRKEKVILMSASPFDEKNLEPEIPSVAKHLHKPFKLDDFLGVVIDAMDSKISLSM